MKTDDNLKDAFAGESQANRKYLAYGEKADKDGMAQVAKLFRAVAAAETIHAHSHLRALGGIKGTVENLEDAIAGEKFEFTEMYPGYVETAQAEGHKKAALSMKYALDVEVVHHELFTGALDAVKAGNDLPDAPIYVCSVCGHTVIGEAPDRCPVCNVKKEKYTEIA